MMANDKIFKDQKQEVFRVALRKILFIPWWGDHEVTSMNKVFVPFPIDVVESEEDDRTDSILLIRFGLDHPTEGQTNHFIHLFFNGYISRVNDQGIPGLD